MTVEEAKASFDAVTASVTLQTPADLGPLWTWFVVTDDRGGIAVEVKRWSVKR